MSPIGKLDIRLPSGSLSPLFAKTRETTALYQTLLSDATPNTAPAGLDEEIAADVKLNGGPFCGVPRHAEWTSKQVCWKRSATAS